MDSSEEDKKLELIETLAAIALNKEIQINEIPNLLACENQFRAALICSEGTSLIKLLHRMKQHSSHAAVFQACGETHCHECFLDYYGFRRQCEHKQEFTRLEMFEHYKQKGSIFCHLCKADLPSDHFSVGVPDEPCPVCNKCRKISIYRTGFICPKCENPYSKETVKKIRGLSCCVKCWNLEVPTSRHCLNPDHTMCAECAAKDENQCSFCKFEMAECEFCSFEGISVQCSVGHFICDGCMRDKFSCQICGDS